MSPFQFKQLGGRLWIQIYIAWFKLWIVTSKSHTLRFRPGCLKEICWILLNHGMHLKSSSISSVSILHVTICGIPGCHSPTGCPPPKFRKACHDRVTIEPHGQSQEEQMGNTRCMGTDSQEYRMGTGISTTSTGAGFLPSTVLPK